MRHHFTKQCVTFGSALLLGLASGQAQTAPDANRPPQKALISFESNFISRWMTGEKPADNAAAGPAAAPQNAVPQNAAPQNAMTPAVEPTRKALLPPNSILNRNYPPTTSPSATAMPLPPTTLVIGPAPPGPMPGNMPIQQPNAIPLQQPSMLPGTRPMVAPIGTTLPPGVAQAQLVAAQSPVVPGQAPMIIVVPAGWQPDGSVTFAPRTIMSPEVPADHWPTEQRNPFGDRVDRGMFTWPKFAKQIAGATLDGEEAAPQGPPTKALFAASNKPAEVQSMAKPLFAPAVAPVAPPAPESKALFAKQTAPEAKPAEPSLKSRALFAFGRKADAGSATATPATQLADATAAPAAVAAPAAPQANSSATLDPSQAPPEAPNLSDFETVPSAAAPLPTKPQTPKPAEKKTEVAKPGMKWRAKGAPLTEVVAETVKPSSAAAESATPPTQIVKQVAPVVTDKSASAEQPVVAEKPAVADKPAATESATANIPVASTVPANVGPANVGPVNVGQAGVPKSAPAETPTAAAAPAVANQRALFASSFFSRGKAPAAHALAPSRLAAPAPPVAPVRPAEKAIVPNLMAMIPGLKDAAVQGAATDATKVTPAAAIEVASTPHCEPVSQVSTHGQMPSARSTQSYYAPAAEYPTEEHQIAERPIARRATPVATSSRRKVARQTEEPEVTEGVEEFVEEPPVESKYAESEHVESMLDEPMMSREKRRPAVESPLERNPRQAETSYGTPSNGARAAELRSTKTYRRLTAKDLTKGLSRPLNALNQFTKLPPTITRYTDATTNADLEAFEQDARGRYAHNNEDAVTSHPSLKRTPVARRPNSRPAPEAKQDAAAALASDDEGRPVHPVAAPSVVRSGRRRVVAPVVVNEPVDSELENSEFENGDAQVDASEEEPAEPEVKATRVRNKNGASVLIYSGADLSHDHGKSAVRVSNTETSDSRHGNPLR